MRMARSSAVLAARVTPISSIGSWSVVTRWTQSGARPEFTVVTGISTGSLTAPFAYLGPPYDKLLTAAYTQISGEDVFRRKPVLRILGSTSAADNTPSSATLQCCCVSL